MANSVKEAARERAGRTLAQGLAIDVIVAVAAAMLVWLPDADVLSTSAWVILAVSLLKSGLTAVASYVVRLRLEPHTETATASVSHAFELEAAGWDEPANDWGQSPGAGSPR